MISATVPLELSISAPSGHFPFVSTKPESLLFTALYRRSLPYAYLESALLFTIAGFDANAGTVTSRLGTINLNATDTEATIWAAEAVMGRPMVGQCPSEIASFPLS